MAASKSLLPILAGALLAPALLTAPAAAGSIPQSLSTVNSTSQVISTTRSPRSSDQKAIFSSFFDDRQLLAENPLQKQLADPPSPLDPITPAWQSVFLKEGSVSFSMPAGLLTEETVVLPTRVGPVSFRSLAANSEATRYVVGYADQLTDDQLKKPQALLTAIINRVISAPNFTLVQNLPARLSISRGRELTYESNTDVIVFRAYLKRDRVYVIGVRTPKSDEIPSRDIVSFFKSFQFVNLQPTPGA